MSRGAKQSGSTPAPRPPPRRRRAATPNTNIYSKTIKVDELINTPPSCKPEALTSVEDTGLELTVESLLAKATDKEGKALSLLGLRIQTESKLAGRIERRSGGKREPKAGLLAAYFASDSIALPLIDAETDKAAATFWKTKLGVGIGNGRIDFNSFPNTRKVLADIVLTVPELRQKWKPGVPWPLLPLHMQHNFFARITGTITLERDDTVRFLATAISAATLYIDGAPILVAKEDRLGSLTGYHFAGDGLLDLAKGPHTVRLEYYSDSDPRGRPEFQVRWPVTPLGIYSNGNVC